MSQPSSRKKVPCLQRGPVPGPASPGRELLHCAARASRDRLTSLALSTFKKEDYSFVGVSVLGCEVVSSIH